MGVDRPDRTHTWIKSGQIIIFHQPRFPWNKVISLTKLPFKVRSCEVAIIWVDKMLKMLKVKVNQWSSVVTLSPVKPCQYPQYFLRDAPVNPVKVTKSSVFYRAKKITHTGVLIGFGVFFLVRYTQKYSGNNESMSGTNSNKSGLVLFKGKVDNKSNYGFLRGIQCSGWFKESQWISQLLPIFCLCKLTLSSKENNCFCFALFLPFFGRKPSTFHDPR